ncbi:hypothetical protein V502_02964, partial [Pseudogymnoascus sp. VKM F-4520 (FW-2644)]
MTRVRGTASPRGGDYPDQVSEWISAGTEYLYYQWTDVLCDEVSQVTGIVRGSQGDTTISSVAGRATIRSVSCETATRMGIRLTTQDYRNVAIEMGREYIGAEFMREIPTTEEMPHEDMDVVVSAVDLAAAHGKDIAERYGVRGDIIRNLSDESIRIFGAIGSQWHQLLGLDSRKPVPLGKRDRGLSYGTPAPSLNPKRSRSPLGRPVPLIFTPPLTSPSRGGFLTPTSPSWAGNETESGFEPMVLPSRPRPEAARTGVLQLAKVPTYSEEEI